MGDEDIKRQFGCRLRELRKQRELSQEQLATAAGIDRTYVSGCERGNRNISLVNVGKLARALGVDPAVLLTASEEGECPPHGK
jgi:transcriptional regulator with XRE-family HTH domain